MSESRALIADSVNRLFADKIDRALLERFEAGEWLASLWHQVEENGFDQVLCLEGAAPDWLDAQSVLRAIGYYRVPLPLAESIVARWLIACAGLAADDGPLTIAQCGAAMALRIEGESLLLDGSLARVAWARHAKRIVLSGECAGRAVMGVLNPASATGIRLEHDVSIAAEPRDTVVCERARCESFAFVKTHGPESLGPGSLGPGSLGPGSLGPYAVHQYGALARAAAMGGAIESVLDQAVQYANDRVQFGRPIGKFQAVQHLLAELGSESAAASAAITGACEFAGSAQPVMAIAAAKVRAGEAAKHAARIAHQVHGAIGFTYEHTLHFATRRLWAWRNEFGNDAHWARELGAAIIVAGGGQFWGNLTAR
jgi:acyl-CoA dehydrogenase